VPACVGAHALLWTLIPALTNANLPLDVIEALAWGREWRLGYDKHPPLSAWAAELAAIVGARSDIALYALSQVCVGIGALLMWRLARDILDDGRAALATLMLLAGVHYMHFTSPEFNVNVLQIPLWAGLFLCFWRAVRAGSSQHGAGTRDHGAEQKDPVPEPRPLVSALAWLGVGGCFGLAMLTKYLAVFALPALGLFALATPSGLRALRTARPYLAGLLAAALFLPHLLWMVETDFMTLRYGLARSSPDASGAAAHLIYPVKFVAAQALACAPALLLLLSGSAKLTLARDPLAPDGTTLTRRALRRAEDRLWIWLCALAPVGVMALYALLTGARLRSMWGAPMVLGVPLLLATLARFDPARPRGRAIVTTWAILTGAALGAYAIDNAVAPAFTRDAKRTNFPGRALAENIEGEWTKRHPDEPLPIVIGDEWHAGNVSWYGASRASVYIHADPQRAFWLSDDAVRRRGAMAVWSRPKGSERAKAFLDDLRARFPDLVALEPVLLRPSLRGLIEGDLPPQRIGRAYIPPAATR